MFNLVGLVLFVCLFLIWKIIIPHKVSGTNQYCGLFKFGDTFIINISIRNLLSLAFSFS